MAKIFLVTTEDGDTSPGAFLDEEKAIAACQVANKEHQVFDPYFVHDIEVTAAPHEWKKYCPVCQAREAFYAGQEDNKK